MPALHGEEPGVGHLCWRCLTPLSSHATTDPMLAISARADLFTKASYTPRRPMTVIGMWLLLGPMFLMCAAWVLVMWVLAMLREVAFSEFVAASVISALPLFITGKLLWRTTTNYFKAGKNEEEEEEEWEGEAVERVSHAGAGQGEWEGDEEAGEADSDAGARQD